MFNPFVIHNVPPFLENLSKLLRASPCKRPKMVGCPKLNDDVVKSKSACIAKILHLQVYRSSVGYMPAIWTSSSLRLGNKGSRCINSCEDTSRTLTLIIQSPYRISLLTSIIVTSSQHDAFRLRLYNDRFVRCRSQSHRHHR